MQHPRSSAVLQLIRDFERVLPQAGEEANLDMSLYMHMGSNVACGTIACHAGWYELATRYKRRLLVRGNPMLYMSEDLNLSQVGEEFEFCIPILYWAYKNPKVWGNEDGRLMYAQPKAFSHPERRPDGAKKLQDIVDHWKEVYERLCKLEGTVSVYAYPDKTKELAILPADEVADIIIKKEMSSV